MPYVGFLGETSSVTNGYNFIELPFWVSNNAALGPCKFIDGLTIDAYNLLHNAAPCGITIMKRFKQASKKSPRVSVTLSEDESAKLDTLSSTSKLTRSWLGRYAISRLLDAYSAGQLDLPLPQQDEEAK